VTAPKGLTAIYALVDPRDCKIRYIGKSNKPKVRYRSYTCYTRTRTTPIIRWCNKLHDQGVKPKMRVICWVDDWEEAERKYIKLARETRDMLNIENGGESNKTSTKGISNAFKTYRSVRASMSRHITWLRKNDKHLDAEQHQKKFDDLTKKVQKIRLKGPLEMEGFYQRVHARFGSN